MEGRVTWGEIVEYLAIIRKLFPDAPDAIMDIAGVTGSDITPQQILELARGPRKYARVAIVAGEPSQFGLARMYQIAAEVQPQQKVSQVVSTEQEALEWLLKERSAAAGAGG